MNGGKRRLAALAAMAVLPAALAAAALELTACSARRGEPLKGPLDLSDARIAHGQAVFMAKCNKCHPGGDAGLGPALNNKPLPDFLVRYQVRHGIGAMPAFYAEEIPEKSLDDINAYLEALRGNT
jgi:mono/diheme cytochrome c family protein